VLTDLPVEANLRGRQLAAAGEFGAVPELREFRDAAAKWKSGAGLTLRD
jgi:hypothetical protein